MTTSKEDVTINKLENRVTKLEEGQQTLIAGMSRIETLASQLMDNQKGVFGRLNRPWQWSVVVAIFAGLFTLSGGFATALTLIIDPIKGAIAQIQYDDHEADARNRRYHDELLERTHQNEIASAINKESIRWMEKVEERYYLATTGSQAKAGQGQGVCCGRGGPPGKE